MFFLIFFIFMQIPSLEESLKGFFERYLSWEKLSREHQTFKAKEFIDNFKEFNLMLNPKDFDFILMEGKKKRKIDINLEIETIPITSFGKSKVRIGGDEFSQDTEIDKAPYDYTTIKRKIKKKIQNSYKLYYAKAKNEYVSNFIQSNFRVRVEAYIFVVEGLELNQELLKENSLNLRIFSIKDLCYPRSKPSKFWRNIIFYGIYEKS